MYLREIQQDITEIFEKLQVPLNASGPLYIAQPAQSIAMPLHKHLQVISSRPEDRQDMYFVQRTKTNWMKTAHLTPTHLGLVMIHIHAIVWIRVEHWAYWRPQLSAAEWLAIFPISKIFQQPTWRSSRRAACSEYSLCSTASRLCSCVFSSCSSLLSCSVVHAAFYLKEFPELKNNLLPFPKAQQLQGGPQKSKPLSSIIIKSY